MMGRGLNTKEQTVISNTIRRLSKMCDSPTLYVGHTIPIEWALLMLEDAINGEGIYLKILQQTISAETALKWDEADKLLQLLTDRKKAIHEAVEKGEY